MNNRKKLALLLVAVVAAGCSSSRRGNEGQMNLYPVPSVEAKWIRGGEPIEFEGERWFPQDSIETLLDSEVLLLGDFRGVQFFVDRIDIRPYQRLYTKFGKNKFRSFSKKEQIP